jgi:bifunctional non-homologous end joining protein LigD
MPLLKRRSAFDDPNWIFELKYDGFRALARVENGRTSLISRNGNTFASFEPLQQNIGASLPNDSVVLDGEIVCLDRKGRPKFNDLLFRRGDPCFFAFDLLFMNGQDMRTAQLAERKHELRRLLTRVPADSRVRYAEHLERLGTRLFEQVCALDLEGIVAKQKFAPYTSDRQISTWYKIRNPHYSQMVGREKLFERDRHDEPVAGWHGCTLACAYAEAN